MLRLPLTALIAALATPALAETPPDYLDDRSTPAQVVASLYNAINRHEYLRGWTYYSQNFAPDYETFRDGYADTETVELRLGETTSEGAAGSVHSMVPVAIRATASDGTQAVFAGCYKLTQVQPAIQEVPPFRPIQIDSGTLAESDQDFGTAMGSCAP